MGRHIWKMLDIGRSLHVSPAVSWMHVKLIDRELLCIVYLRIGNISVIFVMVYGTILKVTMDGRIQRR